MYILNDITFIAHPRTASRAVAKALLAVGAEQVAGHHRINVPRLTDTVVCVKRNMFDILVSWWHNQNHKLGTNEPLNANYKSFEDYVYEKTDTNHQWFIDPVYHYGLLYAGMVIEFENLWGGVDTMFELMGLGPVSLPRIGASKRTYYQDYYTPELRRVVEDRWAEDLRITGYSFDNRSEYGILSV